MQKFSLELPKFRLELHARLVKRRKPLLDEPLIPSVTEVKKKYRSGTILGKFVRHISGHKNVRKIFAGNLAAVAIVTSFLPSIKTNTVLASDEPIIQTQTQLTTEKGIQSPVELFKINQNYNFFHPGIDLGGPIGESIKPIKSGLVVEAGFSRDGYGNTIFIDHGNGISSRYAHLSKIEVKVGDRVNMDTEIGKLGITGHTTGPHLHLEIRENGKAISPLTVLPQ
jgi:murein DD-endopeptidase MepM/ murein hydrolase activator NlpD